MKADVFLIDPATGRKVIAKSYDYDEPSDLDPDERMNIAEQLAEDCEPADSVYLLVTVDFSERQLFCDRVAVECEHSWSVVPTTTAAGP